jgi:hypothetical protein
MRINHRPKHVIITAVLSLLAGGAARAGEVTHFSANGSFASVNTFDGTASLDLFVSRNDLGSSATTNLFFNRQTCGATSCSGILGFGVIPNINFSVGAGNARLNTNLATVSGFTVFSYFLDFSTGQSTQTPIAGSVVTIDWHLMPRNSTTRNGSESVTSGGYSLRYFGQQTAYRATATGTCFGTAVAPGGSNLVGSNKTATITITRD